MPVKDRGPLTEAMFYILMVLSRDDVCGTEISAAVAQITQGRVKLGPGTLYTLLAKFLDEGLMTETETSGRKRTYGITPKGLAVYERELGRMRQCLRDAASAAEAHADPVFPGSIPARDPAGSGDRNRSAYEEVSADA